MHSEYLRKLYLDNDLAEGRFSVDGRPVTVSDIRAPVFCLGTRKDHVAPWRSVFKWNQLTDTDVTFLLTEGGHNAGIVSEPGHRNRSFQVSTRSDLDLHTDPDTWEARAPRFEGSWWPTFAAWLKDSSSGCADPPPLGAPDRGYPALCDAPGVYVHQK
jgi:polyhydroxyalkanoate synthase subunit PhaC